MGLTKSINWLTPLAQPKSIGCRRITQCRCSRGGDSGLVLLLPGRFLVDWLRSGALFQCRELSSQLKWSLSSSSFKASRKAHCYWWVLQQAAFFSMLNSRFNWLAGLKPLQPAIAKGKHLLQLISREILPKELRFFSDHFACYRDMLFGALHPFIYRLLQFWPHGLSSRGIGRRNWRSWYGLAPNFVMTYTLSSVKNSIYIDTFVEILVVPISYVEISGNVKAKRKSQLSGLLYLFLLYIIYSRDLARYMNTWISEATMMHPTTAGPQKSLKNMK